MLLGVVAASWLSVVAAAAMFCVEFQLSHLGSQFDLRRIFALMVTFHSAIGIGEALITGSVVSLVLRQRPDLIFEPITGSRASGAATRIGSTIITGVVAALAIAAFLAPFASSYDDGLEAVGGREFASTMEADPTVLVLDGYSIPLPIAGWQESELWQKVSVSLAGILGTAAVLLIAWMLDRSLRLRTAAAACNHAE